MKRLLLLAPLILTSCAAGHDLMSDEPFQMKCQDMFMTSGVPQAGYMIGGPKLPLAQARMWNGSHMSMLERIETSPENITFKLESNKQIMAAHIDRIKRDVYVGEWSEGGEIIANSKTLLKCRFKPLNLRFGWGSWAQVWP